MAKYVDISDGSEPGVPAYTGTGHAGTEVDPFSYDDWDSYIDANPGETYYVRGWFATLASGEHIDGFVHPTTVFTWERWGAKPWRIRTVDWPGRDWDMNLATVKGGILITSSLLYVGNVSDMIIGYPPRHLGAGPQLIENSTICLPYISDSIGDGETLTLNRCVMPNKAGGPPWYLYYSGTRVVNLQDIATGCVDYALLAGGGATFNDLGGIIYSQNPSIPNQQSIPFDWTLPETSYDYVPGYGVGALGGWAAPSKPEWASTYPKAGTIGGTSVEILSQTDMDGTSYAVVVPDGAAAPTAQQVKDSEDSTGTPVAAGFANSVALIADTEANMFLTNLVSETAYDIYVVAEGALLQDNPVKLDVTTSDITDPINAAGYPKLDDVDETISSFLAKTNEDGMAYVVIVSRGATAPTSAQVKAGQDSTGTLVAAGFSGSASLVANTEATLNVSNLSIGTRYDAYVVCEDASYNLQANPVKIEFSTIPKIISQMNVPKSYIGSYVVINVNGLIVTTDKSYPGAFTIEVEVGNQYEIVPYTGLDATGTKVRIKVLSQTDDECFVLIKVNDGENDSNTFYYKIVIVAGTEKPKTKPVGYGIDVTTRQ